MSKELCSHIYEKGKKVGQQCTTRAKKCGKHQPKQVEEEAPAKAHSHQGCGQAVQGQASPVSCGGPSHEAQLEEAPSLANLRVATYYPPRRPFDEPHNRSYFLTVDVLRVTVPTIHSMYQGVQQNVIKKVKKYFIGHILNTI